MKPESIARWGRWVRWHTPILALPFRRRAVKRLAYWRLMPATIPHLMAALESPDARVRQTATQALGALRENPVCVDALCATWAKERNATLGKLVAECRYQATAPVQLRVLSGLQAGRLEELAREGAEAVPPLVAALGEKDKALAAGARRVLETFASADALVDSADALVDYALNQAAGAALLPLINSRGYRHSIEGRWFLYLALAGRFDDYLASDFEFQTLRAEFRAAPPELQARVREAIVRSGDTRMNALFVLEKKQTLLADLSDHDAELLVKLNARNQNWEALFKFLWVLPARRIREAVAAMVKAGWQPEDADRQALFYKLAGFVDAIGEAPKVATAPVLSNPVLQQWLARGEKEWAKQPEAELRERLKDEVPPSDQIAALGALRAQGQLTPQVLDRAGRSQQWLVRLAAAALGGQAEPVNDGGKEWFTRLQTALDAESVWGLKPCHVPRDGLEALQEGLARLPDRRVAGGLNLLEAVVAHYTAHDIEIEVGARVVVGEDSFEIGG
jgi:hypothetical protein